MPQPSDATFEIVRSAQQSAVRALIAMEEAGKAMLGLHLKALENDIKGARSALTALSAASDWNAFQGLPAKFLAEQAERNHDFSRQLSKLLIELETNCFDHLRSSVEQWDAFQRSALTRGGGYAPISESMKAIFENVGQALAFPATDSSDGTDAPAVAAAD